MKVYYILLICLLLFALNKAEAQVVITGQITTKAHDSIPGASVVIRNGTNPVVLAFSISKQNGRYYLNIPKLSDSVILEVSSIGFTSHLVKIKLQSQILDVELEHSFSKLRELVVKSPLIWKRNDTVNYSVPSFLSPGDKVIGDVISRLPGVEVLASGEIKYNGKPISNFYVEGLDLLEQRYGLATNNIPVDIVDGIQILENHQPIKVLDNLVFSDQPAINIKLKQSAKVKLLGTAEISIGSPKLLTQDELSAMIFRKNLQSLNIYKFNNTGNDISKELNNQFEVQNQDILHQDLSKKHILSLPEFKLPEALSERSLFNTSHLASINQLKKINDNTQFRFNLDYLNNLQNSDLQLQNIFYFPSDTISLLELSTNTFKTNSLSAEATLIKNDNKGYLKDQLLFKKDWNNASGTMATFNQMDQYLNTPSQMTSNTLRYIKVSGKMNYELNSYIGYSLSPQTLKIVPGQYIEIFNQNQLYNNLIQKALLQTALVNQSLILRRHFKFLTTQNSIGISLQNKDFTSELTKGIATYNTLISDSFKNNLNWRNCSLNNENSIYVTLNKDKVVIKFPITYSFLAYKDPTFNSRQEYNFFNVSPLLQWTHIINPLLNFSTSIGYNRQIGDFDEVTKSYILQTYRTMSNHQGLLPQNSNKNSTALVIYRNPLKMSFGNIGASYIQKLSNFTSVQQFHQTLESLSPEAKDNLSENLNVFGRWGKYMNLIKMTLAFGMNYSSTTANILQGKLLSSVNNRNLSYDLNVENKYSNAVTSGLNIKFTQSHYIRNLSSQNISSSFLGSKFFINYYKNETLLNFVVQYYQMETGTINHQVLFSDVYLRHEIKKYRMKYEVAVRNLFNTASFTNSTFNDFSQVIITVPIRPRDILFKIYFSF